MENKYLKIRLYKKKNKEEFVALALFQEKQQVEIKNFKFEEQSIDMVDCYTFKDENMFDLMSKETANADEYFSENAHNLIHMKDVAFNDLKYANQQFIDFVLKAKEVEKTYIKLKERYAPLIRERVLAKSFFLPNHLKENDLYEKLEQSFHRTVMNYTPNEQSTMEQFETYLKIVLDREVIQAIKQGTN